MWLTALAVALVAVARFVDWLREDHSLDDAALYDRLWGLVRQEGLGVFPKRSGMWNRENGADSAGQYRGSMRTIFLAPEWLRCPWVLAHELGHHFVYTRHGPHTEADADRMAYGLVRRSCGWRWPWMRRKAAVWFDGSGSITLAKVDVL